MTEEEGEAQKEERDTGREEKRGEDKGTTMKKMREQVSCSYLTVAVLLQSPQQHVKLHGRQRT